jgi:hypothetical protein
VTDQLKYINILSLGFTFALFDLIIIASEALHSPRVADHFAFCETNTSNFQRAHYSQDENSAFKQVIKYDSCFP